MSSLVSYGKLRPAFIGALGVIFSELFRRAEGEEFPSALKRVRELIEFADSGVWGDESVDPSFDFRVFRVSDFRGDFELDPHSAPLRSIPARKQGKYRLQRGDILVVKSSGSAKQVVSGRVAVFDIDDEQSYAASNFLLRLRPSREIDPYYFAFALGSPPVRERIADSVKTMTYPNLPFKLYRDLNVPVIPISDQRQVASFLQAFRHREELPGLPPYLTEQRRIVSRIEELAVKVAEACALRKQATEEATALGDAGRNVFFSSAAEQFGSSRLEELSTRITKGESPEWQGFTYQEEGPLFIRSENVLWGVLNPTNAVHIPEAFHNKLSRSQLRGGDVLINLVGASIGRACAVPNGLGAANVNQAVGVITPDREKLLPDFLVHFLLSPVTQDVIHGGKVETARPNISLGDVRDLQVPTPPLAEQRRIVNELDGLQAQVDSLQELQSETAAKLDALMPSILDKAFRGGL